MLYAAVQTREAAGSKLATARTAALWTVQIAVAAFFVMGGMGKLTGAPEMVGLFEAIGAGQWFRYLTGGMEVGGAVLLVIPGLAGLGALVLASVMAGAVLTHLFLIGGSAAMATALLLITSFIAFARRREVFGLADRLGSAAGRTQ